jgi:NADH-quinone oxidoreductase subunit I
MFITDFVEKVVRVSKALTRKSPAYGHDYRYEAAHHPQRYRGQHRVDYETCIGCDACNKICPVNAITMKKLPFKKQNIVPEVNLAVCIFCGLCEDVCPTKPEKAIKLSGGRYDMLTGGWHEDQDDFWVHVNIPEEYIKSRLEAEEAARVAKEMKQKKLEAEKRKKEAEEAAKKAQEAQGAPAAEQASSPSPTESGLPDFSAPAPGMEEGGEPEAQSAEPKAKSPMRITGGAKPTTNDQRPTTKAKNPPKGGKK